MSFENGIDETPAVHQLLANIKGALPALEELRDDRLMMFAYVDGVYRFYHQSFKVYLLQGNTATIVDALRKLAPEGCSLNKWFEQIISDGTGKSWTEEHNQRWLQETRPIIEAFLHAKYFLDMICRYGRKLEVPPALMESGWAAVLYLYNLR